MTKLNVYIKIKYLRMNQQKGKMVIMYKAFFSLLFCIDKNYVYTTKTLF